MNEVTFAMVGAVLYAALAVLGCHMLGYQWVGFFAGYMVVATVDLWRCWRSTPWRRVRATSLELAIAVFLLFPFGSLLWLPWDATRLVRAQYRA